MTLRVSSPNREPPMEASKWLKVQLLIETDEMRTLFAALEPFEIFLTGGVTPQGGGLVSHEEFLTLYQHYIASLKAGILPNDSDYRLYFSSVFTRARDHLYVVPVGEGRQLVRVARPVVQLQAHSMDYSIHDEKFRPNVFGLDSITWGIQFSYPQLFLEPDTKEPKAVEEGETFPNTLLFHQIQRWVRHHTIPTPFIVGEKKVNVPIRLGKQCLPWIHRHPQLEGKRLKVFVHGD